MNTINYFAIPGLKNKASKNLCIGKENIIKSVLAHLDIKREDLTGKSRKRDIVFARHTTCYFLFKFSNLNKTKIAAELNRDHTTICYILKAIRNLIDTEQDVRDQFEIMQQKIFIESN